MDGKSNNKKMMTNQQFGEKKASYMENYKDFLSEIEKLSTSIEKNKEDKEYKFLEEKEAINSLEGKFKFLEEEKDLLEENKNALSKDHNKELRNNLKNLGELKIKLEECKRKLETLEKEREDKKETIGVLETKNKELNNRLEELSIIANEREIQLNSEKEKLSKKEEELKGAQKEIEVLKGRLKEDEKNVANDSLRLMIEEAVDFLGIRAENKERAEEKLKKIISLTDELCKYWEKIEILFKEKLGKETSIKEELERLPEIVEVLREFKLDNNKEEIRKALSKGIEFEKLVKELIKELFAYDEGETFEKNLEKFKEEFKRMKDNESKVEDSSPSIKRLQKEIDNLNLKMGGKDLEIKRLEGLVNDWEFTNGKSTQWLKELKIKTSKERKDKLESINTSLEQKDQIRREILGEEINRIKGLNNIFKSSTAVLALFLISYFSYSALRSRKDNEVTTHTEE